MQNHATTIRLEILTKTGSDRCVNSHTEILSPQDGNFQLMTQLSRKGSIIMDYNGIGYGL